MMVHRIITGVSGFFKDMTGFLPSLIFSYIPIEKSVDLVYIFLRVFLPAPMLTLRFAISWLRDLSGLINEKLDLILLIP